MANSGTSALSTDTALCCSSSSKPPCFAEAVELARVLAALADRFDSVCSLWSPPKSRVLL